MEPKIQKFNPVGFEQVTLCPGNGTQYELLFFGPIEETCDAGVFGRLVGCTDNAYLVSCSIGRRAVLLKRRGPLALDYVREKFGVNWEDAAAICKGIGVHLRRPYQLETGMWVDLPDKE